MGCQISQPEPRLHEELNRLCDRIEDIRIRDHDLEMLTLCTLEEVGIILRSSYSVCPSILTRVNFVRDLYRISRSRAFTAPVKHAFDAIEQKVAKKVRSMDKHGRCQQRRSIDTATATDERPSLRDSGSDHLPQQRSFLDPIELLPPASPMSLRSAKLRTSSVDTTCTQDTMSSGKFKSLYLCPHNSVSQETLGDFGFFDGESMIEIKVAWVFTQRCNSLSSITVPLSGRTTTSILKSSFVSFIFRDSFAPDNRARFIYFPRNLAFLSLLRLCLYFSHLFLLFFFLNAPRLVPHQIRLSCSHLYSDAGRALAFDLRRHIFWLWFPIFFVQFLLDASRKDTLILVLSLSLSTRLYLVFFYFCVPMIACSSRHCSLIAPIRLYSGQSKHTLGMQSKWFGRLNTPPITRILIRRSILSVWVILI